MNRQGMVQLVGAGPGDKKLITLKARECLEKAEVIVYDRLAGPGVLQYANPEAEWIDAGKGPGCHGMEQSQINELLIEKALAGKLVVRLKGGDPLVFGRGGEEAETLARRGIPFIIVPGVTSAVAVPAYAGIPVTHRDFCSSLHIVTGHENPEKSRSRLDYQALAALEGTLIFLMAAGNLESIAANLVAHGKDPETPAAVIQNGTTFAQKVVTACLRELGAAATAAGIKSPTVIVIGPVAALRERLNWFPPGPLGGKRILVTRDRERSGGLVRLIEELGGEAVEIPVIKRVAAEPPDREAFQEALRRLAEYTWVLFTSVNGVDIFFQTLREAGLDLRALVTLKFGVTGAATAEELWRRGFRADLVPSRYTSEALLSALLAQATSADRILLVRAKQASLELPRGLAAARINYTDIAAYQTRAAERIHEELQAHLRWGGIDILTFTSASTVRHFVAALQGDGLERLNPGKVVCIGPETARAAMEAGLEVSAVADVHTSAGLIAKILEMERRMVE
jgi:uroporphyrinogen III methyltransferase/synthase